MDMAQGTVYNKEQERLFEKSIDCFFDIWYHTYMDKETEFIVKNELTYGRGYVYSLQYHLVWCTKYRKKVLRSGIDTECREMLEALAGEYKFTITAMEVMPDHIHLLVDCRPQFYIPDMIKIMKGNLARWLFIRHPELREELWGGHLWNPSYCAVTVSDRSREQVERYILTQKDRA
jgi:putative transposase